MAISPNSPRPLSKTHECPRPGCDRRVDNAMFSCATDWFALPARIRVEIRDTAKLNLLHSRRRAAIADARRYWSMATRRTE